MLIRHGARQARALACAQSSSATSALLFTNVQTSTPVAPPTRSLCARQFHSSPQSLSRIGSAPISVPPGVDIAVTLPPKVELKPGQRVNEVFGSVHVKGPLGERTMQIPSFVTITRNEKGDVTVAVNDSEIRKEREMWGTTRNYIRNHILGVSEGHACILRLVGVGFRATVESSATTVSPTYKGQKFINLKVGYSHPVELGIPEGVTASTPQPTRILLEGIDKHTVTQFAARIRKWRVPEPYKGKGIFVDGETIKLKAKKIK